MMSGSQQRATADNCMNYLNIGKNPYSSISAYLTKDDSSDLQ
jgi:hypothetical protein